MKNTHPNSRLVLRLSGLIFLLIQLCDIDARLGAQSQYVTPDGDGDITFTPGLRIQVRYALDQKDNNHDIFIRRLRMKGKGKIFDLANYYFEVKIDNAGRFDSQPRAQVENAWLNFPVAPDIDIRAGLYDMVFSRNALTSDSKLLVMDRSLIKIALTALGITDNTVGILVHGRPLDGHLSYGAGIFDNIGFEVAGSEEVLTRKEDDIMTSARLVYDFLDPAPAHGYADYKDSYIGEGQRLSLGANGAYLSDAQIGETRFNMFAWGIDLFFNSGPWAFGAEYDNYKEDITEGEIPSFVGDGWFVQGGYLLFPFLELAAQYQELDPDHNDDTDKLKWTTIGLNLYIRKHNLKIQTGYIIKDEQSDSEKNNLFQAQLQFDF